MQALDRLITLAAVRGRLDLRCQFQGDWAVAHEAQETGAAGYHIVLSGTCEVQVQGVQGVQGAQAGQAGSVEPLQAGDILVFPAGSAHLLRSTGPAVAPAPAVVRPQDGPVPLHTLGAPGPAVDILCGRFLYQSGALLMAALPPVIKVAHPQPHGPLAALVQLLRAEAENAGPGARFLVDTLSSALFALVVRAYLQQQAPPPGTLALLMDPRLGRVWQAMLDDPAHAWSTDELAALAHMSKPTFMRLFTKAAGESPGALLTRVRMQSACTLLARTQLSLTDIAARVGYQSQAAFSKKFSDSFGLAPGRFRRLQGEA